MPSTATTVGLVAQASPERAAAALLDAWHRGDPVGAAQVATPAAVTSLFARPSAPTETRGCQNPLEGVATCSFGMNGTLLNLHAEATLAGGWIIDVATFEG